jgi:hypothetical protein
LVLAALAQLAHHQTEVILFLRQLHPMVVAMAAAIFLKTQIVVVLAAAEQEMTSEELEMVAQGHLVRGTQEAMPLGKLVAAVALVELAVVVGHRLEVMAEAESHHQLLGQRLRAVAVAVGQAVT